MDAKKKTKTPRIDRAHSYCLASGCRQAPHSRGLCVNHYKAALRCIQAGKTTWERLISKGFAEKKKRAGRKPSEFVREITS